MIAMTKINKYLNLLDPHRKAWLPYVGKVKTFRGRVERFGHKHRQGADIKRGATLVLTDVHLKGSQNKIDHAWIDYIPELAVFGAEIRPGSRIEFDAQVDFYTKGGKNIYGKGSGTFDDLELTNIKQVKILSHPRLKKTDLVGANLVSYAIGTKTNVKRGLYLGLDPQKRLGKIYVGQTFANRLARRLSYEFHE